MMKKLLLILLSFLISGCFAPLPLEEESEEMTGKTVGFELYIPKSETRASGKEDLKSFWLVDYVRGQEEQVCVWDEIPGNITVELLPGDHTLAFIASGTPRDDCKYSRGQFFSSGDTFARVVSIRTKDLEPGKEYPVVLTRITTGFRLDTEIGSSVVIYSSWCPLEDTVDNIGGIYAFPGETYYSMVSPNTPLVITLRDQDYTLLRNHFYIFSDTGVSEEEKGEEVPLDNTYLVHENDTAIFYISAYEEIGVKNPNGSGWEPESYKDGWRAPTRQEAKEFFKYCYIPDTWRIRPDERCLAWDEVSGQWYTFRWCSGSSGSITLAGSSVPYTYKPILSVSKESLEKITGDFEIGIDFTWETPGEKNF